jgi:hypothetical protein
VVQEPAGVEQDVDEENAQQQKSRTAFCCKSGTSSTGYAVTAAEPADWLSTQTLRYTTHQWP